MVELFSLDKKYPDEMILSMEYDFYDLFSMFTPFSDQGFLPLFLATRWGIVFFCGNPVFSTMTASI